MNKKQMRDAVQDAITSSDETDVTLVAEGIQGTARMWGRLDVFLSTLEINLWRIDGELSKEIREFRTCVQQGRNPLLDAAPDTQEKAK